ncbi:M14 family metallopeptidase [Kitasatospora azatica]|uniref:M14 family metallopeptidase n=1 Tax=Kitasatospora azatica TaxID=58347 RepID=UPI0006918316|nr:M14 family metallopeptidase [Kitasatospora azatica]
MYLNVDEVDSAVVNLAGAFPAICQLITLPHQTVEGRTCHALRLGGGAAGSRPAVVMIGGVHAREWGSCEILIGFAADLLHAYTSGTGLGYGATSYTAAQVQAIVDNLHVLVFPLVNPDGRHYSQTVQALWRKNRNPANSGGSAACVGVDINRNFDFLFDYKTAFSSSSQISGYVSDNPCDFQVYHGPAAFSEPETENVKWLLDTNPRTRWLVDTHSYSEDMLYNWGDDQNQSTDPTMNFRNPAYNGKRGIPNDAYREYIPSPDLAVASTLATRFTGAVQAVRGKSYTPKTGFQLYPTSGTSDDYAFSRYFSDPTQEKVYGFTIEWGTEFQPPWAEMQLIVADIGSGLVEFCLAAQEVVPRACSLVLDRSTFGRDEVDTLLGQALDPGVVDPAFWVLVDGFSPAELGITALSGSAAPPSQAQLDGWAPVITITPPVPGMSVAVVAVSSDDPSLSAQQQRFTFGYRIRFTSDAGFPTAPGAVGFTTLTAATHGLSASAPLELTNTPDPFLTNGRTSWLSIDLRVFSVTTGQSRFGVPMGSDGPGFIRAVLDGLRGGNGMAGGESFENLPVDEEPSAVHVLPTTSVGGVPVPVYDFALARVRYRALALPADDVRVFFRLFQVQSTDVSFQPLTSYRRSAPNPDGQPIPLAGISGSDYVTIPCFAGERVPAATTAMTRQTDPHNILRLPATGGPEVDTYFGCWLDINQPSRNVLPPAVPPGNPDGPFAAAVPIQQAIIRNPHQCLIAEIAYDPVAVPTGATPSTSDKLAQRNLAWSDLA